MKKIILICLCSTLSLTACHNPTKENATKKQSIITVKAEPFVKKVYYVGNIEPLKTTVITSPEEGTVKDLYFQYGDSVKRNQLLIQLTSKAFLKNFSESLIQYLKAKDSYNTSLTQLQNTKNLWTAGLVSKNEYENTKSTFYNNNLAMTQAYDTMMKMLSESRRHIDIKHLNIQDTQKINDIIHTKKIPALPIDAASDGIALLPEASGENISESIALQKGSAIKKGQALLQIGKLDGASVNINVSEIDINKIKVGLAAVVTSAAFPELTLKGEVTSVGAQAKSKQTDLPSFPVRISIKTLSPSERKVVRVGMSTKVEIIIKNENSIQVPLRAIIQENNQTSVEMIDERSGEKKLIPVKVGDTTQNAISIIEGLKDGDKILVTD